MIFRYEYGFAPSLSPRNTLVFRRTHRCAPLSRTPRVPAVPVRRADRGACAGCRSVGSEVPGRGPVRGGPKRPGRVPARGRSGPHSRPGTVSTGPAFHPSSRPPSGTGIDEFPGECDSTRFASPARGIRPGPDRLAAAPGASGPAGGPVDGRGAGLRRVRYPGHDRAQYTGNTRKGAEDRGRKGAVIPTADAVHPAGWFAQGNLQPEQPSCKGTRRPPPPTEQAEFRSDPRGGL